MRESHKTLLMFKQKLCKLLGLAWYIQNSKMKEINKQKSFTQRGDKDGKVCHQLSHHGHIKNTSIYLHVE